jgi:DNA-binding transcriptional ArsR family regulator
VEAALKAIVEPKRREILRLVRNDELSAGEIASQFDISWPAVSQHLGVLKEAGLVDERRNGTKRLYRARPQGLADLKAFLDEFWGERLGALKQEAERGLAARCSDPHLCPGSTDRIGVYRRTRHR